MSSPVAARIPSDRKREGKPADRLFALLDRLFTRPLVIARRRCKQVSPDGELAYCLPSRKYGDKSRFSAVCGLADPVVLNPASGRECLCTEGPPLAPRPVVAAGAAGMAEKDVGPGAVAPPVEVLELRGERVSDSRLEALDVRFERGPGDWLVVSIDVLNRLETPIRYASLEVELYDGAGAIAARSLTSVGDLAPGETRRLRVGKSVAGPASYRMRFKSVLAAPAAGSPAA